MSDFSAFSNWRSDEYGNLYAPNEVGGETVISDADIGGLQPEYAARIVACINACAGLSTKSLVASTIDIRLNELDSLACSGLHASPALKHGWLQDIRAKIKAARS